MKIIEMDGTDRRLVNILQTDFPLTAEPFACMASSLGLREQEVLKRVSGLQSKQIIRIIGPVFNSRSLVYHSTLLAMRVPEERIEQAAGLINRHPGVGHNYQRDHYYNLWFTVALPEDTDIQETLQELRQQISPEEMFDLPALRLFR